MKFIKGSISPKAEEKTFYELSGLVPDFSNPIFNNKPKEKYIWTLFKQDKTTGWKQVSNNIKYGEKAPYTFGEKVVGIPYRIEVHTENKNLLNVTERKFIANLVVKPRTAKEPVIGRVILLNRGNSDVNKAKFSESLSAEARTSNLFGKEITFYLWEEGASEADKYKKPKKAFVDKNGIAKVTFSLSEYATPKTRMIFFTGDKNTTKKFFVSAVYENKKATNKTPVVASDGTTQTTNPPANNNSNNRGSGIISRLTEIVAEGMGSITSTTTENTRTATSVEQRQNSQTSTSNCGEKYCIKIGDKSELIREINIRLAGFGGNVPTSEFTGRTEKMIKQFQRDYMKVPETGKVCGNVLRAIDDFQNKYIINFDDVKCPCGKCKGFGNGKFSEQKQNSKIEEKIRKYEYPGIHRSLIWALRAAMFYTTVIEKEMKYSVKCIFSGYRCHENNKQHKRTSTNHMGKALDIHFNKSGKRTQVPKEVEEIRQKIFVKHLGNQVRWRDNNKFSLEPGIPEYKGEFIASTWIHYDVRQFELKYLTDEFFVKDINKVNGESIVSLAAKTNNEICKCMGGGAVKQINTPAIIPKVQNNGFTENDGKEALKVIYNKYGKDMAIIIERMYRDETRHFQSGQYKACGTGGMEAFGSAPYYGWDKSFFEANPEFRPVGIWSAYENKGMSGQGGNKQITDRKKEFVVLPSVLAGMEYKAFYIKKHNGNWARWHSTKESNQKTYKTHIESIKPRFVNEFEKSK